MKSELRFTREIRNLLKNTQDSDMSFLFSTIPQESRDNKTEIAAYILVKTLKESLYKGQIFCLKMSITEKYPIESPDVMFIPGKEIFKDIERFSDVKFQMDKKNLNYFETVSPYGIHSDSNNITSDDSSEYMMKKSKMLTSIFDLDRVREFLFCSASFENSTKKEKKSSFFKGMRNFFISSSCRQKSENDNSQTYKSGSTHTSSSSLDSTLENESGFDRKNILSKQISKEEKLNQILYFINTLKIPVHPHIYSNGHICSSLMKDWLPVLTMTSISLTYLSALNTNTKLNGPPNDKMYSFLSKKGSRSTTWVLEGEM